MAQTPGVESPGTSAEANVQFLTYDFSTVDNWPCFSPDGKNILFSRSVDGGMTYALYLVPVSGGKPHKLTEESLPVSAARAAWSAAGDVIAFTGQSRDGKSSLWVINGDGGNPHQVAAASLSDKVVDPAWYPDGKQVAVTDVGQEVLQRVDVQQGSGAPLTTPERVLAATPSVSPDGKLIAFAGRPHAASGKDQPKTALWLVDEKSAARPMGTAEISGRAPAWSPDGQWLAFESNRIGTPELSAVYLIKRDGSHLKQITEYELNASRPVWSPDGQSLAVSGRFIKGHIRTGIVLLKLQAAAKN
jgi:Tol biopolymer transport system component